VSEPGKYGFVLLVALVVIVLDQITKSWIASSMELYESIRIFSWCNLTYVRNTGAAFSLFADHSAAFRVPFFGVVFLLAGTAIVFFVRQTPATQRLVLVACGLVLGGALGNLIDRVLHGAVIDFVDVHWRGMHWPAFNVADSAISVGVVVLLLRGVFVGDDPRPEAERTAAA
jgi:signal peptidase II